MLRHILRNIQHMLVLSSVLLVFMALQRLHQFDFPLHASSGRIEDYQPGEPSKLGGHAQFAFGRDMKIGLFTFMFPKMERKIDPSWRPDLDHGRIKKRKKGVIVMVDIKDCKESSIDAAIVLKQSIHNFGDYDVKVHGIFPQYCNGQNATLQLVRGRWLDHVTFLPKTAIWQILGHELSKTARLVIKVPIETIVVGLADATSETSRLGTSAAIAGRRLLSGDTAPQDIEWIRPSPRLTKNMTLAEQSALRCSSYPCIVPALSLIFDLFNDTCHSPWECQNSPSVFDTCKDLLEQWQIARRKVFGGIEQYTTCDTENKYKPMLKPKRPKTTITSTNYE